MSRVAPSPTFVDAEQLLSKQSSESRNSDVSPALEKDEVLSRLELDGGTSPDESKAVTPEKIPSLSYSTQASNEVDSSWSTSPPRTPNRPPGSLQPSSPNSAPQQRKASESLRTKNRGRRVSLDRALIELDEHQSSDSAADCKWQNVASENHGVSKVATVVHDECDSSDGEDSYFVKHLPSPKSGRSFSNSNNSAPKTALISSKDTEASLSFSDESDDDLPMPKSHLPLTKPQTKDSADMHLYPVRIDRMHSVSSLVSSGSSEEGRKSPTRRERTGQSSESTLSPDTSGSGSETELRTVTAGSSQNQGLKHHSERPSGRRSPLLGEHNTPTSYSSVGVGLSPSQFVPNRNPHASPPMLYQGFTSQEANIPHPQALAPDHMPPWMLAANVAYHPHVARVQPHYGNSQALNAAFNHARHNSTGKESSKSSRSSDGALPFVYSDDDTINETTPFINHFTNTIPMQGQGGLTYKTLESNHGLMNKKMEAGANPEHNEERYRAKRKTDILNDDELDDTRPIHGQNNAAYSGSDEFSVYWQRWIMLFYMSLLNLLSDWTCYSVAPIAILTAAEYGSVDPEQLVVVFLVANTLATTCEPLLLARLGLKRTIVLGALFLMLGSVIKSGGYPPLYATELVKGENTWRLYIGFFLVGLSQPLYQCTPALLSASWFPENERTLATGVALNSNQLGIGCAFIFGTLMVSDVDDIPVYFGILSIISTIAFFGILFQFDDAPPTPPSASARVMRGDVTVPGIETIFDSVRKFGTTKNDSEGETSERSSRRRRPTQRRQESGVKDVNASTLKRSNSSDSRRSRQRSGSASRKQGRRSTTPTDPEVGFTRRRAASSRVQTANTDNGFRAFQGKSTSAPSPASSKRANSDVRVEAVRFSIEGMTIAAPSPSPMMAGSVQSMSSGRHREDSSSGYKEAPRNSNFENEQIQGTSNANRGSYAGLPYPSSLPPNDAFHVPYYQHPYVVPTSQYIDTRYIQEGLMQRGDPTFQQSWMYYQQQPYAQLPHFNGYPASPSHSQYAYQSNPMVVEKGLDEGVEPVLTLRPRNLEIHIRDDQIFLSIRACLTRTGFIHALVAFTVSGIVLNTLSTYMDYLVTLNGGSRKLVGIVGGSFQLVIMIASLVVGKRTDKTRAYYAVIIALLLFGAFALAECGVSLDGNRGTELRWALIVVAALVGPLQPVSTELGVEVAYPLSENTVLVIQQLFSNFFSAIFIPIFKSLKDVGVSEVSTEGTEIDEQPEYTFSFYLLIVLHAFATVFFATFNGHYHRYENERGSTGREREELQNVTPAFHPISRSMNFTQSESFEDQRVK